ncbi:MAG: hypothetical protein SGARI_002950, partial [Bacillariaceae sp.]
MSSSTNNASSTPYTNIGSDGILRGPASSPKGNDDVEGGNDLGIQRLHRDYLQGLDAAIVQNLPWSTMEDKWAVSNLLEKRGWAMLGWTRGITIVLYSVLATFVLFVIFAPRIREDVEGTTRQYFRTIGVGMFICFLVAICVTLGLYCYYARLDQQLQHMVRRLMDEKDIGISQERPAMSRDSHSQQAIFELPEFINVMWKGASKAAQCQEVGDDGSASAAGPAPSHRSQVSAITMGSFTKR